MPELPIRIPVEDGRVLLEGLFQEGSTGRYAILCHPLPLYGGNMHNNVVSTAQSTFAACGWGTLRFNFRGVGNSGGRPGEDEKEAQDLLAVADYLIGVGRHPGTINIAGYSYGAWIALKAIVLGLAPESLCLFSPPLDFISFSGLAIPDVPTLITLGNTDEFCAVESLRKWLDGQPHARERVSLEILPYCDHFYWGFERELSSKIEPFLKISYPMDITDKSGG